MSPAFAALRSRLAPFPEALQSFLWMMILVIAMYAGAGGARRGSANRLFGILGTVLGLVFGAALLLAPAGGVVTCPGGACFKPLVGYSVTLLHAIERTDIVVHVPALPEADDGP